VLTKLVKLESDTFSGYSKTISVVADTLSVDLLFRLETTVKTVLFFDKKKFGEQIVVHFAILDFLKN
jgi:hypothetical protein